MRIETPSPRPVPCRKCSTLAIYVRTREFENSDARVWMCANTKCTSHGLYFHTDHLHVPARREFLTIGTRSVLFGAHQFIVHPICVAIAWWRLYGFPWHPYLWLCFAVHDLGYIGKRDIDGEDGRSHPELGAKIVRRLTRSEKWATFCLCHSRHYAKQAGHTASRLCVADKLAFAVTPRWLYLLCTAATGELEEYTANGRKASTPPCTFHEAWCMRSAIPTFWHTGLRSYMIRWVGRHHHDQDDTWTSQEQEGMHASVPRRTL